VTFIGQKVKQAKLQTIAMKKQDESDSDEEILTDFTKSNLISDDEDVNQKDTLLNSSILPPVHHNKTDM
jgi:hypothetical protein